MVILTVKMNLDMKKCILVLAVLFLSAPVFAQVNNNVKYEKKGDVTIATYFYEDGTVQQQGTFNENGKLHGTWTSYDVNGDKLAVGNYTNGMKTGKWFFWTDNSLKEVDYVGSRIASVNEWKNKTQVAIRDK